MNTYSLIKQIRVGNFEYIKANVNKDTLELNHLLAEAACCNNEEILILLLENGATDYNWAMNCAALAGGRNIVKILLNKGANNYQNVLETASELGYEDIIYLMLEQMKGKGYNYDQAVKIASNKEIKEIIIAYKDGKVKL